MPAILPIDFRSLTGEANSMLHGDVYHPAWDLIFPANGVGKTPNCQQYTNTDGFGYGNATRVNRQQNEASGDKIAKEWVVPPGCTSATLEMEMMLPTGIGGTQTVRFGIYQVDGTTAVQTALATVTGSMVKYSVTATGLTPGTEMRVVLKVFDTADGTTSNATVAVGKVTLRPNNATSEPWNGEFLRFPTLPSLWHDNRISDIASRKLNAGGYSRFVFRTKARKIAIEYTRSAGSNASNDVCVFVNGECAGTIQLAGTNALNLATFDLPYGSIYKEVELITPAFSNGITPPGAPVLGGTFINALYVARNTDTEIVPPYENSSGRRTLLIYGDSTSCGFGSPNTGMNGLVTYLRRTFPGRVIAEAWGSRSLAEDCGDNAVLPVVDSAAKRLAFCRKIAQVRPTDLWGSIGTNDYNGAYWATVAAYGTCDLNLLNQLMAICPEMRIWWQSPLSRSTETANANGWTLPQLRTQIQTDVGAVTVPASANIPVYVDGASILTFGTGTNNLYGDTVHPNANGTAKWAEFIRSTIGW